MKVALCHLELSNGPEQKNIELLEKAVRIAAEKGANWVITPETAVQGYYFYKLEPETKVDKQPSSKLSFLLSLVKDGCLDRKSTRLNSSHSSPSRMPSSA